MHSHLCLICIWGCFRYDSFLQPPAVEPSTKGMFVSPTFNKSSNPHKCFNKSSSKKKETVANNELRLDEKGDITWHGHTHTHFGKMFWTPGVFSSVMEPGSWLEPNSLKLRYLAPGKKYLHFNGPRRWHEHISVEALTELVDNSY